MKPHTIRNRPHSRVIRSTLVGSTVLVLGLIVGQADVHAQFIGFNFDSGNASGAEASGARSTAVGAGSTASGDRSSAFGRLALAEGDNSSAFGRVTEATGTTSSAFGHASTASGDRSSAFGGGAEASGDNSSAFGQVAIASGTNSSAFGRAASAEFDESTALGAGATTTRAGQMMFGTAANTYTTPGITSAASRAAQSGPITIVTSDAGGNLATSDTNSLLAGSSTFGRLQSDVRNNTEGVAMAMALSGIPNTLPVDSTYAVSANWGGFNGENAMAVGGAVRLTNNIFLNGGGAFGTEGGSNGGGRAGLTWAW